MRKLRRALVGALVGITALSLVVTEPVSADDGGDEMAFVAKLNELRTSRGLAPLATKGELFNLARTWSTQMAGVGGISHNGALAAQAPANWLRLGENVGMGMTVAALHDAFVASPHHFENMIDARWDSVGVGVVRNAAGMIFVTVNFMLTKPAPVMTTASVASTSAAPARKRVCTRNRKGRRVCRTIRVR